MTGEGYLVGQRKQQEDVVPQNPKQKNVLMDKSPNTLNANERSIKMRQKINHCFWQRGVSEWKQGIRS